MRRLLLELTILFLVGLTPLLWYKPGYMALGHDMGFPLAPVDHFQDRLFVWTERIGSFGSNQSEALSGFFIHGLEAFLYFVGFSLVDTQKITFVFWMLLPGLSMYVLLRSLHKEKDNWILRISGSLFYMINHFFLQAWFIAERTKFSAAVALPLITLFAINGLFRGGSILKNGLMIGLVLFFFNAGQGVPLYAGLGVVMLCVFVFFALASVNKQTSLVRIKKSASLGLISLTTFLLLNIYWIGPLWYYSTQNFSARVGQAGGTEGSIDWSRGISKNTSFSNLLRLQGIPDWYDNLEHPYANNFIYNPILIVISFLWPFLAFGSLVFVYKRSSHDKLLVSFFVLLALVGMLFTAGSHPPTGVVYEFLLRYMPGFSVLRTPFYKFGIILWFAYSYLIAVSLSSVYSKFGNAEYPNKFIRRGSYLVLPLFILILAVYNYPYFSGIFFNWSRSYSTMVQVPSYVFEFKKWADSLKISSDRILLAPNLDPHPEYEIYDWKYFSLSTIPTILTRKSVVANDAYLKGNEKALLNALYDNLSFKHDFALARYLSIGHILFREDFNAPQNGNYETGLLKEAIKNSGLFYKDAEFGKWSIYNPVKNERFPVIYPSVENTFINAAMDEASLFSAIPGVGLRDSFFVTSSFVKEDQIPKESFQTRILEGSCKNCFQEQIEVKPPEARLFPQSQLVYFFETWREKRQEQRITDPEQHIDFLLGMILKKETLIRNTLENSKNFTLLPEVLDSVGSGFKKIDTLYEQIPSRSQRNFYKKRIVVYKGYIENKTGQWIRSVNDPLLQDKLYELKWVLANLPLRKFVSDFDDRYLYYGFSAPASANYEIFLYLDDFLLQGLGAQKVGLDLDGVKYATASSSIKGNWSLLGSSSLGEGYHELGISLPTSRDMTDRGIERSFEVSSPRGQLTCKVLDIGSVTQRLDYNISFLYRTGIGEPIRFRLMQNTHLLGQGKRSPYKTETVLNTVLNKEASGKRYITAYTPNKYTTSAKVEFCIDSDETEDSKTFIDQFLVTASSQPKVFLVSHNDSSQHSPPEISFGRLNQTKYLISVKGATSPFFLNFTQRFDPAWKLTEVSVKDGSAFFEGQSIISESYHSKEYQVQDGSLKEMLIDKNKEEDAHHFLNNGFANSWLVRKPGDYYFILEYEPQSVFYKSTIVSIAALMVVVSVVCYLHFRKKKYVTKV